MLSTSDRGGIRIQYSKNPFGKKRDASGNWISTNENCGMSIGTPVQDPAAPGQPSALCHTDDGFSHCTSAQPCARQIHATMLERVPSVEAGWMAGLEA